MIHSGSVIAAGISQGRSTSLKRDFKVSSLLPTRTTTHPWEAPPGPWPLPRPSPRHAERGGKSDSWTH